MTPPLEPVFRLFCLREKCCQAHAPKSVCHLFVVHLLSDDDAKETFYGRAEGSFEFIRLAMLIFFLVWHGFE